MSRQADSPKRRGECSAIGSAPLLECGCFSGSPGAMTPQLAADVICYGGMLALADGPWILRTHQTTDKVLYECVSGNETRNFLSRLAGQSVLKSRLQGCQFERTNINDTNAFYNATVQERREKGRPLTGALACYSRAIYWSSFRQLHRLRRSLRRERRAVSLQ